MTKYRNVEYIGGFTNQKIPKLSKGFILEVRDTEIAIWHSSFAYSKYKEIITFSDLEAISSAITQVHKSLSAKKAAVGTILLPGVETVIGAAMGGKKKDFRLTLTHTVDSRRVTLELETKQNEAIEHMVLANMKKAGYYFADLSKEIVELSQSKSNYIAELKELADLKQKGILTQEEFEVQKARILANQ